MTENEKCNRCKEEKTPAHVPFYVHEAEMYRWEHEVKRMRILAAVGIAATVCTNAVWMLHYFGVF